MTTELGYMERTRYVMQDLLNIMEKLRAPGGCPWDQAQTHLTLRRYMIEEAWECIAAIDQDDTEHLAEELGDLLFQIVFHASIAKSYDEFTFSDTVNTICRKMIYRHPHVFERINGHSSMPSEADWEKLKRSESGNKTIPESLDDVSEALPALKYTEKMLKKLTSIETYRIKPAECVDSLEDIIQQIRKLNTALTAEKAGILLYWAEVLCFSMGYDGELLLHQITDRLKAAVKSTENMTNDRKSPESLTFQELRVYLNHVEGEIE